MTATTTTTWSISHISAVRASITVTGSILEPHGTHTVIPISIQKERPSEKLTSPNFDSRKQLLSEGFSLFDGELGK